MRIIDIQETSVKLEVRIHNAAFSFDGLAIVVLRALLKWLEYMAKIHRPLHPTMAT